jgi:sugar phosphate permease
MIGLMAADDSAQVPQLRMSSAAGRWVLLATVLGSSMALLDSTVVNVALPTIGRNLGASLAGLQWTVTAYTLTLAALILLGGSLGDRFGRRRVFLVGVVWFALASALCGFAPSIGVLIGARVLQGIGGALLTPGSLAIIQATFAADDRPRAVGAWSGRVRDRPGTRRLACPGRWLAVGVLPEPSAGRRGRRGHYPACAGNQGHLRARRL